MSPRIRRIVRLFALVAASLAASVAATDACSCVNGGGGAAVCEQYRSFDVAFVGRATVVPPDSASGRVHFRVTQALKGVAGLDVEVPRRGSAMGGAACYREFDVGEKYIVFARRDADGEIDISPCRSLVWPVNVDPNGPQGPDYQRQSIEAVELALSLRKPAAGGRIFGEVTIRAPFSIPDGADGIRRVDGATVILRGPEQARRATTVDGQYEFTGLTPGAYSVSVAMPDGLPTARSARLPEDPAEQFRFYSYDEREYMRSLTIADARDCSYEPFEARFDGEVSGTVVRHDGTPSDQQTIELFPTTLDPLQREGNPALVNTDERGRFRVPHIPPGRYIVGINLRHGASESAPFAPTFYREPGADEPSIIELGYGSHADLGVLRLPAPLIKRQIAGTVTWSDGRSADSVLVKICEAGSKRLRVYCETYEVGDDGGFSAAVFAGTTYNVTAEAFDARGRWDMAYKEIPPVATAQVAVTLDAADVSGVSLVLVPRLGRR